MNLIVAFPFASYARGELITDSAAIEAILAGESAGHVRKVPAEAAPAVPEPVAPVIAEAAESAAPVEQPAATSDSAA